MQCRTCGNDVLEQAVVCVSCGVPPLAGNKHCQQCGAETNPVAVVCIKCGVPLKTGGLKNKILSRVGTGETIVPSDPPKDPILMAVLSGCTVPWLGQILLGQKTKGIVMMIVTVLSALLMVGIFLWPVAAVDAYLVGKKLREGKPVREWEFF
jgi:hypothetical protein